MHHNSSPFHISFLSSPKKTNPKKQKRKTKPIQNKNNNNKIGEEGR
jgi:hypothetical protein